MKRIWKAYFTFSKKEKSAVIFLLLLIVLFLALPFFYSNKKEKPQVNKALSDFVSKNVRHIPIPDSFTDNSESIDIPPEKKSSPSFSLFYFDPNTLTGTEWKQLGLRDKTVQTILNYRNKGGHFNTPEDIRKIWGIKKEDADRIIPFAKIQQRAYPVSPKKSYETFKRASSGKNEKFIPQIIDINLATFEDWKTLPGIGEVLANRIVKFREHLGGFMLVEQVSKTYGVSDSVFRRIMPYLKIITTSIPRININQISAYDLKIRAEIPDLVAKAIIGYRQQVGRFTKVEELKKIVFITDSIYQKLEKRITVE